MAHLIDKHLVERANTALGILGCAGDLRTRGAGL
jgi:hypothetical protein